MKTSTRILLVLGIILTTIPLFMKDMIILTDGLDGFLRGCGMSLMIGAMIIYWKNKKRIEAK